jgi:hypothetical protein
MLLKKRERLALYFVGLVQILKALDAAYLFNVFYNAIGNECLPFFVFKNPISNFCCRVEITFVEGARSYLVSSFFEEATG